MYKIAPIAFISVASAVSSYLVEQPRDDMNAGSLIVYLNMISLNNLLQMALPMFSYMMFQDTTGQIPLGNKVGNTFIIDQYSSSIWYKAFINNVTFDQVSLYG